MRDPIIDEIHRIREDLASRFDFNVAAICADVRAKQALVKDRRTITIEKSMRRAQSAPLLD